MKILLKTVKFKGEMELLSGTAVKGSSDDLHIGGADSEVIKNPITMMPYIPGSSLKGKMRSLLELKLGKVQDDKHGKGNPCGCGQADCIICTIFGAYKNINAASAPTRIIVRDCNLTKDSEKKIREMELEAGSFLEEKTENIIDRNTGAAGSPRTIERVPAGLKFAVEIILQIFEGDNEQEMREAVDQALDLLRNSYIGNSGSRGYGNVEIHGDWEET